MIRQWIVNHIVNEIAKWINSWAVQRTETKLKKLGYDDVKVKGNWRGAPKG